MDQTPETREPVLVSACLLGRRCRYDGGANRDRALEAELEARGERALPFCPEEHGGLGTPRPPAWIEARSAEAVLDGTDRVVAETLDGPRDVTAGFIAGAEGALALCRAHAIRRAYLKERSPSCGVCNTHVAGGLVAGPGVTAALLARHGIETVPVEKVVSGAGRPRARGSRAARGPASRTGRGRSRGRRA